MKTANTTVNEESLNGGFTAIPKDANRAVEVSVDADLGATGMEYGEMNERDAKASGYTKANGQAADLAKHDVEGSPTGAYTDVGHGRSSAVKKH